MSRNLEEIIEKYRILGDDATYLRLTSEHYQRGMLARVNEYNRERIREQEEEEVERCIAELEGNIKGYRNKKARERAFADG